MDFQKNKFNNKQKNGNSSMDEHDEFHLKDHLNASFDKDNIVASEELIQKTLQAIQSGKSPLTAEEDIPEENAAIEHKKKNRFPIFRLAGIAAVILILLIGLNLLKYLSIGNKKKMANDVNFAAEDTAESAVKQKESRTLERSTEAKKNEEAYSIADAGAQEEEQEGSENDAKTFSEESFNKEDGSAPQKANMDISKAESMTLSNILPFTADQVSSVSIVNNKKEKAVLKKSEKIKEFLLMLDEYSLQSVENEEDTSENPLDYQIVFTTRDNLSYTILVGNEIQLKTDDNNSDIIRYTIIGDEDQLKSRLSEYR